MSIPTTLASAARNGAATRTLPGFKILVSCAASAAAFSLFWSSENSSTTPPVITFRVFSALTPTSARGMLPLAAANTGGGSSPPFPADSFLRFGAFLGFFDLGPGVVFAECFSANAFFLSLLLSTVCHSITLPF